MNTTEGLVVSFLRSPSRRECEAYPVRFTIRRRKDSPMTHRRRPLLIMYALLVIAPVEVQRAALPATAQPGPPTVVYRSESFERTTGQPNAFQATFPACDSTSVHRLLVENGPQGARRVSSGTVIVNGTVVIDPSDLHSQNGELVRSISLLPENTLELRLGGGPGGQVRITVDGYPRCGLHVRITAPPSGATLPNPATLVQGELESAAPATLRLLVAVPFNGTTLESAVPVEVYRGRFAAWVPLTAGVVQVKAVATDDVGRTAEDVIQLAVAASPQARPSRPEITPTVGFAPLTVTIEGRPASDPDVDLFDVDLDGDGQPDLRRADFAASPHQRTHTFPTEGLYIVTVTMRDGTTGETLSSQVPISVIPRPDVAVIWDSFRAALGRGDVDGALRFVADGARERYRRALLDLAPDLPAVAATLQDVTVEVMEAEYAMASTLRTLDGNSEGFVISFLRDRDGVWRIASM
jgi:hypothetical protein